jgi:hypothetical protein
MPFQVVFNTVQIGLPTVVLLSAGSDRNVACGSTVNLEGVVDIPENLPGHNILWEQTAGIPVTFSNPNSLVTSYSFTERSDKGFRLWIDKGTPFQQFKEVFIFHTPTSVCQMSLSNSATIRELKADIVDSSSIIGQLTVGDTPPSPDGPVDRSPCQAGGDAPISGINFDLIVSWTVPTTKPEMVPFFLDTQLFYADSDTSASPRYTTAPGSVVEHHFLPGGENELKRYYVVTRYKIGGQIITGQSGEVDFTGFTIPTAHLIDDKASIQLSNSSTEVTRYTSIILIGTTVTGQMRLSAGEIEIQRYIPTKLEGPLSIQQVMRLSNSAINIIRFDPTGIGS